MRWEGRRQSENVEDRRGTPVGGMVAGGGIGLLLMVLLISLLGGNPKPLLEQAQQPTGAAGEARPVDPAQEPLKQFVSVVLADTEDIWQDLFQKQLQKTYRVPKLVLFSDRVESACGLANAAVGPFYCPADERVYIDLVFCQEMKDKFQAPGDFAIAYVLAHEIGHHVQKQLGFTELVDRQRRQASEAQGNELSVRLELQADFLAGVWAHHAQQMKQVLEAGDVQEALQAASAVGDDRIQKQTQGYVVPDSFTHGSSEQRAKWFGLGLQTGDLSRMNDLFELPYGRL